jgi:hypothetical protein
MVVEKPLLVGFVLDRERRWGVGGVWRVCMVPPPVATGGVGERGGGVSLCGGCLR